MFEPRPIAPYKVLWGHRLAYIVLIPVFHTNSCNGDTSQMHAWLSKERIPVQLHMSASEPYFSRIPWGLFEATPSLFPNTEGLHTVRIAYFCNSP